MDAVVEGGGARGELAEARGEGEQLGHELVEEKVGVGDAGRGEPGGGAGGEPGLEGGEERGERGDKGGTAGVKVLGIAETGEGRAKI